MVGNRSDELLLKTRTEYMDPQRANKNSHRMTRSGLRHGLAAYSQIQTGASRGSKTEEGDGNRCSRDLQSTLLKTIPAIPVIIKGDGRIELLAITHLAADADFEDVGDGFNASTIKVYCGGRY